MYHRAYAIAAVACRACGNGANLNDYANAAAAYKAGLNDTNLNTNPATRSFFHAS